MASDSQRMTKEEKRQARIKRQNEKMAEYQAKQQNKQPRPRKRLFPESWGKYALPVVIIIALALSVAGKVSITYDDDSFLVKAFVQQVDIPYANISSVEYYDSAERGRLDQGRMQGFFSLDTLRVKAGSFSRSSLLQEEAYSMFSSMQLYADARYKGDYVLMTVMDEQLGIEQLYVIGAKTIDAQELYDNIRQHTNL